MALDAEYDMAERRTKINILPHHPILLQHPVTRGIRHLALVGLRDLLRPGHGALLCLALFPFEDSPNQWQYRGLDRRELPDQDKSGNM